MSSLRRLRHPRRLLGVLGVAWLAWLSGGLFPANASAEASAPAAEPDFRNHLDREVSAGRLSADESLLVRFQRVFAPEQLPERFAAPDAWPAKSATLLVAEFAERADALSPATAQRLDEMLHRSATDAPFLHRTPHFRFEYALTGPDAVAADDVTPANGVPDFVDLVAAAAETSWQRLVQEARFELPATDGEGRVRVGFREMAAYGYTRVPEEGAEITIHRSFLDFPANLDPEGSAAGAAKVTIAHELKHASQHAASGWTEGGWLEADATWAEDFVFDEVDDYLRYLPHGSPISHPQNWFPISYEDCLWMMALEQTHGEAVLFDFFVRRAGYAGEPVLHSFDRVLQAHGVDLERAAATLGVWCHFTGVHAPGRPQGFRDAELYPTPPLHETFFDPSTSIARTLPSLGSHRFLLMPEERSGPLRIEFAGSSAAGWSVNAVCVDRSGEPRVYGVPIAAAGVASQALDVRWEDLALVYVVLTRLDAGEGAAGYTFSVDDRNAVGVDALATAGRLRLAPNRPNPFRTSTTVSYELPTDSVARLDVFDVRGRHVRRLVDARFHRAGAHGVAWDGLDDQGRRAASGVYAIRLRTGDRVASRPVLLIR